MLYFKPSPHDGLCGFVAAINAIRYLQRRAALTEQLDDAEFFNEAVECLARVPGCDLRILKNDPAIGGIDPFQIRDLCVLISERVGLGVHVRLANVSEKLPFAARYRSAFERGVPFAFVVPYRDGSHWVAALPNDDQSYRLVDDGGARICLLRRGDGPKLAAQSVIALWGIATAPPCPG
ncbi:hypothetical protein [uncultured Sphingomonas sp.]|uniref:hypothetical protein n=1 Tax=uncultured Sphingomonas sp. TaxID=158754 RepID=UPI0025EA5DFB|nr:hypothetical protein [uncultured Sphingomonas sp.]